MLLSRLASDFFTRVIILWVSFAGVFSFTLHQFIFLNYLLHSHDTFSFKTIALPHNLCLFILSLIFFLFICNIVSYILLFIAEVHSCLIGRSDPKIFWGSGSQPVDCDSFDKLLSPKNIYITIQNSRKITVMKEQTNFMFGVTLNMSNCIKESHHEDGWEPLI